ncbi:PAQR family membrane homeostasis protein TrhA [Flavobacterium silvaticum]|uniref:Hemolysin III family protein n=1 Tax=Flavobacterium silvaticum TaxID=1852020 RepID=A0A972FXB2_9FLAO|nr:hemolysin III family protein [Flavobacterium silvaticum]NMH29345.1 hemolysin III family protein [Flavobacterium silvaticum]
MTKLNRPREEFFNVLTHGTGAILSIAAASVLIAIAALRGSAMEIVAASIFGFSLILLYSASTIYHAISSLRYKRIFKRLDHLCIYILIAGTYTPVALLGLRGTWGWVLFGLAWGFAVLGFVFKFSMLRKSEKLSLALYGIMGWMAVIAIKPLLENVDHNALLLILAGGLCYTLGIYFYANDKKKYHHAIWHIFVLGGSAFHFFGIFWYLIP